MRKTLKNKNKIVNETTVNFQGSEHLEGLALGKTLRRFPDWSGTGQTFARLNHTLKVALL